MKWPWSKASAPTAYRAARTALIQQLHDGRPTPMTRETQGPEIYTPGTLRPAFLASQISKNPAEAATVMATPEERRAHVHALEAEQAAWAGRRERLQGDLSRARAEAARIREQLAGAESRERDAEIALGAATATHDAVVIGHERELRKTAPDLIGEVQTYLRDQLEVLHQPGVLKVEERFSGPRDLLTLRRRREFFSNADSLARRQRAIQAALLTWENFRLGGHDAAELQALAEALPGSLPTYEETVPVPTEPLLTPAETRELEWRLAEERR